MTTPDRSDRPWYFEPTNPFIPEHGGEIRNERGKSVCFVGDAETAAKIIAGVNAHDDLVAALRMALETLGNSTPKGKLHPALVQRQRQAEEIARAALAKSSSGSGRGDQ